MGKKRSISNFAYKNDEAKLVELGQFIRDSFPNLQVEREWFIVFDENNKFLKIRRTQPSRGTNYRNPDLMIFKHGFELFCCIEVDGSIHHKKVWKTEIRNAQYKSAGIELIIIDELNLDRNIFDETYNRLSELLNTCKVD